MQWRLTGGRIGASVQRLTVEGDDLAVEGAGETMRPGLKPALEGLGI
jgi:hypothetical protein